MISVTKHAVILNFHLGDRCINESCGGKVAFICRINRFGRKLTFCEDCWELVEMLCDFSVEPWLTPPSKNT